MSGTLKSVADAIADRVLDFARQQRSQPFHMKDLTDQVLGQVTVAPDSPGRILRQLRSAGELNYVVENRAQSLYRFV